MTLQQAQALSTAFKQMIGASSILTEVQRIRLANIKGKGEASYEHSNADSLRLEMLTLFEEGKIDELLGLIGNLPGAKQASKGLRVKLATGKVMPYLQYMSVCGRAILNGTKLPEVKKFIHKRPPTNKRFDTMDVDEFKASDYGPLQYSNGFVISISQHAFRFVKEELYREELIEVDKVYTVSEWQELVNDTHPCMMANYFYSYGIAFRFFEYLVIEGIIGNPGDSDVEMDFDNMCEHFKA